MSSDGSIPQGMPAGKGSGQADGVFPRSVAHFAGTTTIPAAPTRVAVLSTGQADVLLTLGVTPIASTAGDGAKTVPDYLLAAYPQQAAALGQIAGLGSRNEPDIEAIAAAKPDLILVNKAGKDDLDTLVGTLGAIAPTVVTQGTGVYWKQDFLLTADALGKTDAAKSWLTTYQGDASTLGDSLSAKPTVSFLRRNGDRTRVFGVASFPGSVAKDAGLPRPQSQQFIDDTSVDISAEQLAMADGDWIFYGVQGGDAALITGMPLWPQLTAVAAKHTVQVDDDVFYLNTGPTAARLVLDQLSKTLRQG